MASRVNFAESSEDVANIGTSLSKLAEGVSKHVQPEASWLVTGGAISEVYGWSYKSSESEAVFTWRRAS